jgi:hypothetical protein
MSIAFGSVEEEVTDTRSGNVCVLRSDIGKDDPGCSSLTGPGHCCLAKILLAEIGKPKQPEHGIRDTS